MFSFPEVVIVLTLVGVKWVGVETWHGIKAVGSFVAKPFKHKKPVKHPIVTLKKG